MPKTQDTTLTTTLLYADRLNNSVNGNPRWRLATADGSFTTMPDASCGYEVDNILRKRKGTPVGVVVVLTLTPAGRVRLIDVHGSN